MAENTGESGNIKISDDAIAAIAVIAAKDVDGVLDLDSGAAGAIAEALGVKDVTRGVRIDVNGETVNIDINIIVAFGGEVSDIAAEVQDRVRESIESMTGLLVERVNVNINSVRKPSATINSPSNNI